MATPPFILAKSTLDAHKFARENLGLAKGHYRVVTSPSSISGRRNAEIYLVPGWMKRHDRFAMRGALKYSRLKQIHVSDSFHEQVKRPLDADFAAFAARMNEMMASLPPVDARESEGSPDWFRETPESLALLEEARAELAAVEDAAAMSILPELSNVQIRPFTEQEVEALREQTGTTEPSEDAASDEAPKRRRRRCKDCGTLHFKGEACPDVEE